MKPVSDILGKKKKCPIVMANWILSRVRKCCCNDSCVTHYFCLSLQCTASRDPLSIDCLTQLSGLPYSVVLCHGLFVNFNLRVVGLIAFNSSFS